jgi:hypothetical protein
MATYIDASHNMEFSLNPDKWKPDLVKSAEGDITGYQEVELGPTRATLREFCTANNRGLYHPDHSGNPVSWRKDMFSVTRGRDGKPVKGCIQSHPSAEQMGIPVKFNPARDIVYIGFNHKATGKKILRVNVHPTAGATKPESAKDNTDSDELSIYKDWAIGQYWLDILSFVAGQMSIQDPGIATKTNFWDVVTLGGDYNAALNRTDRWYYPGSMLPALFEPDVQMRGIDHLQHAHGSDVHDGRRWAVDGNTDHQIHFVERTFVSITDFPRQF